MTSNVRSADEMRERFRPEFLNRIDEIVVFEPLIEGDFVEGDTVLVDAHDGELFFTKADMAVPAAV